MEHPATKLSDLPLRALAERYLEDFKYDHSVTGFRTYRGWMHRWFHWLNDECGLAEPTIQDFNADCLDEYVRYHKSRPPQRRNLCHPIGDLPDHISSNTVRSAMHPICGLAKWLVKKRVLDFDPTETVSIPSRDGSGTRPVSTDANVIRLIEQAELNPRPKDRALDVAILYVLVNSACRVDEVCKLELTDLDLEAGCFRSLAKGRKRKSKLTYYFSPQTGAAIEEWLKFRPVRCQHGQLFCHGPKRVIADDYIRVMIRRYAAKAGLEGDRGLMPHGLKHLAGCRLLLQGIDIVTVAARLGHTKPTTTLNHYLHVDQVAVRESRFVGLATCKQDDGNHEVNNIPTAATMVVSPTMDCKLSEPIRVPKQVCRAVEKKRVPKNVAIGNARRHRPAAATEGGHPS